jgi:hypothetical protein
VHDQWLHGLRAPDGTLEGEPTALADLARRIREWRRPLTLTAASPYRLCFRLEEPEVNGGARPSPAASLREAWHVRYLLQAQDDPSLLIPAQDAWNPEGQARVRFAQGPFDVREYLLSSLGQAAALCPEVQASLKRPTPGGSRLDATGAHAFLTERAAALEQAGFGVLLPAWWTRKGTKVRLAVSARVKSPKMQGGGGLSLDEVVQFDWHVALGEGTFTLQELEALAKL